MLPDRLLTVVALAAATGAGVTGLVFLDGGSPIGAAAAPSTTPSPWEHRNWTLRGEGWIDVAYNVTPQLDPEDIHIEVTVHWDSIKEPPGARWVCYRYGAATPQVSMNASADSEMAVGCSGHSGGDAHWRYGAEYGPHRLEVDHEPPEICPNVLPRCNREYPWEVKLNTERDVESFLSYAKFRNQSENPVLHWTIATGDPAPDWIRVNATYRDTTLGLADGPPSETFEYYAHDHDAQRGVWTNQWSSRDNATLTTDLEPGPGPLFLTYSPIRLDEWNEERFWYVQPDGWRRTSKSVLSEVSAEDGRWTFGFEHSDGRFPQRITLMGAGFEWAKLPG